MYGYAGSILRVDLSRGSVRPEPLPDSLVKNFIGGRGFVAKLLFDELAPAIDAFDPQNMLIAATGPLTGHFLPASGKTHFGTKSPATGGYADSNMGGHFGPQLKYAGYDLLVITGKADSPSYLFISDDTVEIRSAEDYWGQGSITTEKNLKDHLGDDYQILTIGPAGEKQVRYACISHDFGRQGKNRGRGGDGKQKPESYRSEGN
jgi:aldehyde:ferredoxin oxidoreductase